MAPDDCQNCDGQRSHQDLAGEVCAGMICESCHSTVDKLWEILPSDETVYEAMGMGVYQDSCVRCGTYTTLGDERICESCTRKVRTTRVCSKCFPSICKSCGLYSEIMYYGQECLVCERKKAFKEVSWGVCYNCGDSSQLDKDNICRGCYLAEETKGLLCRKCGSPSPEDLCSMCEAKDITNLIVCTKCKNDFYEDEDSFNGNILCPDCRPSCLACSRKFIPLNKKDVYCGRCYTNLSTMTCVVCNKQNGHLDIHLQCLDCEDPVGYSKTYCQECKIRETPNGERICDQCGAEEEICPNCEINVMNKLDYICKDCQIDDSRGNTKRSHKNMVSN